MTKDKQPVVKLALLQQVAVCTCLPRLRCSSLPQSLLCPALISITWSATRVTALKTKPFLIQLPAASHTLPQLSRRCSCFCFAFEL